LNSKADLQVAAHVLSVGSGTRVDASVERLAPGIYRFAFRVPLPGLWELVMECDGVEAEAVVTFTATVREVDGRLCQLMDSLPEELPCGTSTTLTVQARHPAQR
jgi:hypothetical protein